MDSGGSGGGVDVKFWTFAGGGLPKWKKCEQGGWGSKIWSFCENVLIECPPTRIIGEKLYIRQERNGLLANEQKGCRKGSER